MDIQGRLNLDEKGIAYIQKLYLKVQRPIYHIPKIKQLTCIKMIHCDFCFSESKHQDDYTSIQERLNFGVQICNKCLGKHLHHVPFLQQSINNNSLAWWQFMRLNTDNRFIDNLSPMKSIGISFGEAPYPPVDNIFIDITRVIKVIFSEEKDVIDLIFPVNLEISLKHKEFPKNVKKLNLKEFCNLDQTLNEKTILSRVTKYLVF